VVETAGHVERQANASWLWKGLHAKLVDGFTFTMPDTPENQEAFPQAATQTTGVGFPIARCCAVVSLATACVCDLALGPCEGKETGENALLRDLLDTFDENDVVVPSRLRACFDRYYCPFEAQGMSYMMLAMLLWSGAHVCARVHQRRISDFRRGRRLGHDDHLITWTRPARPDWMSEADYARIPETLTLREVRFDVAVPGRRTEVLIVVTTLIDPQAFSKEDIAALYGFRWNLALSCEGVELDVRNIKQTPALSCEGLGLDHVRCKTPDMVRRELWVTLLAYNLIRTVIATAAAVHGQQPRRLGFALACQTIPSQLRASLASWMLWSTRSCSDARAMYTTTLAHIAADKVANRPGRIEPRVLKRRRHRYPLMQRPRDELRAQLQKM